MRGKARALGFDACRITLAEPPAHARENLSAWLAEGAHGDMTWMSETFERRIDPRALMHDAKSIVVLGLNYGPDADPLAALERPEVGAISVYARHRDYHDVLKGRLKQLAAFFIAAARPEQADVKVFVDTAPLIEKPLAARAGLGWQGKHTNLVSRDFGSWLFLGAILTDLDLPPDAPESTIVDNVAPASTPVRRRRFPRLTGSTRGAAYLTSQSSTKARSRTSFGRQSAIASTVATTAWPSPLEQIRSRRARDEACRARRPQRPAARRTCPP